jgi:hypothetical protein
VHLVVVSDSSDSQSDRRVGGGSHHRGVTSICDGPSDALAVMVLRGHGHGHGLAVGMGVGVGVDVLSVADATVVLMVLVVVVAVVVVTHSCASFAHSISKLWRNGRTLACH